MWPGSLDVQEGEVQEGNGGKRGHHVSGELNGEGADQGKKYRDAVIRRVGKER